MTAPDEATVERAARAMHEVPAQPGIYGRIPWDRLIEQHRDAYRQMAVAALAAAAASVPAVAELRERVEAVAAWCEEQAASRRHYAKVDPGYRNTVIPYEATAERLRAALSAPLAGQHTTDEETDRG